MDFSGYQKIRLCDATKLERAQKGKVYPEGCTLIALSATRGTVEYKAESGEIDSRWAVLIPTEGNESKYIYYSVMHSFPEFLEKYMTGINLQIENLKYLEIAVHPIEKQKKIVRMLEAVEEEQKKEERLLKIWKKAKQYYLGKMFLTNL